MRSEPESSWAKSHCSPGLSNRCQPGRSCWLSAASILGGESRQLALDAQLALGGGARLCTNLGYSACDELPEITQLLLQEDHGPAAEQLIPDFLALRAERRDLYRAGRYQSVEVWPACGYRDFLNCRGRYRTIPRALRDKQINQFIESSARPNVHRVLYLAPTPELPMFSCYSPSGVASKTLLFRDGGLHIEYPAGHLFEGFEAHFHGLCRQSCSSPEQFIGFLYSGSLDPRACA